MTSGEQFQWMSETPKDTASWTTQQILTLFEICASRENPVIYDQAKALMRMLLKSKRVNIGIRYELMTDAQVNSAIDKTFASPRTANAIKELFLFGEIADVRVTPKNKVN